MDDKGRSAPTFTANLPDSKNENVELEKENVALEHHIELDTKENALIVQSIESAGNENSPSSTTTIKEFNVNTTSTESKNAEDSKSDESGIKSPAFSDDNTNVDVITDNDDTGSNDTVRVIEINTNIDTIAPHHEAEETTKSRSNSQVTLQTYKDPSALREDDAKKAVDDSDFNSELDNSPCQCDQIRKDPKIKTKVCVIM